MVKAVSLIRLTNCAAFRNLCRTENLYISKRISARKLIWLFVNIFMEAARKKYVPNYEIIFLEVRNMMLRMIIKKYSINKQFQNITGLSLYGK
jgi:hypothetical protein